MCLAWRGIDAAALAGKGPAHVHELEQEFERVSAALQEYRRGRGGQARSRQSALHGLPLPA
jgi:shikimate kinase